MRPKELFAVAFGTALVVAGCAAPWAQQTHVDLAAPTTKRVTATAEVYMATSCDDRACMTRGGSDALISLSGLPHRVDYSVLVAKGDCSSETEVRVLDHLRAPAIVTEHVDVPLLPLTGGGYVIAVRRISDGRVVACGVIRR